MLFCTGGHISSIPTKSGGCSPIIVGLKPPSTGGGRLMFGSRSMDWKHAIVINIWNWAIEVIYVFNIF